MCLLPLSHSIMFEKGWSLKISDIECSRYSSKVIEKRFTKSGYFIAKFLIPFHAPNTGSLAFVTDIGQSYSDRRSF